MGVRKMYAYNSYIKFMISQILQIKMRLKHYVSKPRHQVDKDKRNKSIVA